MMEWGLPIVCLLIGLLAGWAIAIARAKKTEATLRECEQRTAAAEARAEEVRGRLKAMEGDFERLREKEKVTSAAALENTTSSYSATADSPAAARMQAKPYFRESILGPALGILALVISCWSLQTAIKARTDLFEPRLVASRLLPTDTEGKRGKLFIKNIGGGEAVDVRCHIVNPFSEENSMKYDYWRLSDPFPLIAVDGESIQEATNQKRVRP